MFYQIYFNYNSTGEDIQNLKNFCAPLNLYVETLYPHALTKQNSYKKKISLNQKNITNIFLIWTAENNQKKFELVKNFCNDNFIQLTFLYSIDKGFSEFSKKENKNLPLPIHKIKKIHASKKIELFRNILKTLLYKDNIKNPKELQKEQEILEL